MATFLYRLIYNWLIFCIGGIGSLVCIINVPFCFGLATLPELTGQSTLLAPPENPPRLPLEDRVSRFTRLLTYSWRHLNENSGTHWPEALQPQVDELQATLATYAEALSGDDVEAAKPLAIQAHEQQHDLSHGVEHWLGEVSGAAGVISPQEQLFQATVATYLMDTAGFHGMDERLNGEGVIDPGDAGVVNRVNGILAVTAWPAELQAQVDPLRETLSQYAEALSNDDMEAARPLAAQAHEQQHDLSHGVEHWLGEMSGSGEHGTDEAAEEHGADESGEGHDESEEEGD